MRARVRCECGRWAVLVRTGVVDAMVEVLADALLRGSMRVMAQLTALVSVIVPMAAALPLSVATVVVTPFVVAVDARVTASTRVPVPSGNDNRCASARANASVSGGGGGSLCS